jgi:predicted pyridoxine 5'-phosphate oxidase superfamily flavin-nucleotide-binding protein
MGGGMNETNPFHEGELRAQKLAGETAEGASNGAMIGDKLMIGALRFMRAQKMAILSSRDALGRRWASMLLGAAGFMDPSDRKTVAIAIDAAGNDPSDVLWENLQGDGHVGMLVVDLQTRQRLRVNGRAHFVDSGLTIDVEQSYVNCPKYITRREFEVAQPARVDPKSVPLQGRKLGKAQTALLKATDILFLATGHPERGADASHRGGNPGFVEVMNEKTLRIPDYSGNSLFNTLGNLLVDAHFGMLVPDFRGGRMLQLTGMARVNWSEMDPEHCSGGTGRFVEFQIEEWRERAMAATAADMSVELSPYNPTCVLRHERSNR